VLAVGLVVTLLIAAGREEAALVCLLAGMVLAAAAASLAGSAPPLWTGLGVGYVGLPALALIWLRSVPELGLALLLWLLLVVWATDSAAYFVGRTLRGPRLAPAISPSKTWSGLCGGMLGAAMTGALAAWLLGSGRLLQAAGLGALLAVVAQAGDLVESALKRAAGVKDSGTLIPGHGGLLDRIDGLLFAAPTLALLGLLIGSESLAWR
jgi:phosphatidate cytidylyltransferase